MTDSPTFDANEIARRLADAQASCEPVDFVTSSFPDLTWTEARSIALASDELRRAVGETQVGWKLGWTSAAMSAALGIDRPNWGTLWDRQVARPELELADFIHPKIEPELVWRSPVDLAGDLDALEVEQCGGEWAIGIEVVDPRFPSFNFEALDNTADNSSSAAIRVGDFSSIDGLDDVSVTFTNGIEERSGLASQAMGSPWEAVAWLVRSLAAEGLGIRQGDIIFTGGLTAPFDAAPNTTYTADAHGLAPATLRFA